jgi:hypothetical protein
MARTVGGDEAHAFPHVLTTAPGAVVQRRKQRLALRPAVCKARAFLLGLDATGEKNQGQTTD